MHPFHFGPTQEPLFGIYHPPRGGTPRDTGYVLCYPMGQEYMRAHRAFRQLALMLSRGGFNVLRFDYFATGDSAGDGEAGTLERWAQSITTAANELRDTAAISKVSFIGLRLGAGLAAVAASGRGDVDRLVLWDPVVRGSTYLEEILSAPSSRAWQNGRQPPRSTSSDGVVGVLGFPVTPAMRAGLANLDLCRRPPPAVRQVSIFVSQERPEYHEYRDWLMAARVSVRYQCVPTRGNWNEVDDFGSALLPQEVLQAIVAGVAPEGPP